MADYNIGKAFEEIENELISSMLSNLKRHRAEEAKAGFEWAQWQTEQLNALEAYRRKNQSKFKGYFSNINENIERAVRKAAEAGGTSQEGKILKAIKNGFTPPQSASIGTVSGEFFKTNDRKLNALAEATVHDMEKAETAVLRMSNDKYRSIIYKAQVYANTGAGTYEKAVDTATKDFLSAGINCVEYKNGRRVNIKSYAEMALRTAGKRAYLQGEGEKRREWGIATVILNKRSNPCPKCAPFVGKVFIDDVWSGGSKDGISSVTGLKYPLLSEAISKGLYHPNCKDSHTAYFEGISTPPEDSEYTASELNELAEKYALEQKAKQAENQAERMERMSKYSLDSDNKRVYGRRAEQWKSKAQQLKNQLNKSAVKEESKPKTDNKATVVDKNIVESSAYRRQIDRLSENTKISREIYQQTKDVLAHRSGTEYEDLVFIAADTGKSLIRNDYNVIKQCLPSKAMIKMLEASPPKSIIAIHNHPHSTVPSLADINAARARGYKYGIIACHNGDIYKYAVTGEYNEFLVDCLLDKINKIIYNKEKIGNKFKTKLNKAISELHDNNVDLEVLSWT